MASLSDIVRAFHEKAPHLDEEKLQETISNSADILKNNGFGEKSNPAFDALCMSFGWKDWESIKTAFVGERSFLKDFILKKGVYNEHNHCYIGEHPNVKNMFNLIMNSFAVYGKRIVGASGVQLQRNGHAAFLGMASIAAALDNDSAYRLVEHILLEKKFFADGGECQPASIKGGNTSASRTQYEKMNSAVCIEKKDLRKNFQEIWKNILTRYSMAPLVILSKAWHLSANENNWRMVVGYTMQKNDNDRRGDRRLKPSYAPVSEGVIKIVGKFAKQNKGEYCTGYGSIGQFRQKVRDFLGKDLFGGAMNGIVSDKCLIYISLAAMLQDALLSLQEGGLLKNIDMFENGMAQLEGAFSCEECIENKICNGEHDGYSGKVLRRIEEAERQNFWGVKYSNAVRGFLKGIPDKSTRRYLAILLLAGVPPYEGPKASTTKVRNAMRVLLHAVLQPAGYPDEMPKHMRALNALFHMTSGMAKVRDERIRYEMARRGCRMEDQNV